MKRGNLTFKVLNVSKTDKTVEIQGLCIHRPYITCESLIDLTYQINNSHTTYLLDYILTDFRVSSIKDLTVRETGSTLNFSG